MTQKSHYHDKLVIIITSELYYQNIYLLQKSIYLNLCSVQFFRHESGAVGLKHAMIELEHDLSRLNTHKLYKYGLYGKILLF